MPTLKTLTAICICLCVLSLSGSRCLFSLSVILFEFLLSARSRLCLCSRRSSSSYIVVTGLRVLVPSLTLMLYCHGAEQCALLYSCALRSLLNIVRHESSRCASRDERERERARVIEKNLGRARICVSVYGTHGGKRKVSFCIKSLFYCTARPSVAACL